ncbi:hypothetical protein EYF80_059892 [Liparis tanakae]|uniref:Uncharacterized protein n=1 Tax=Liparis tanakae TaxID=230148 RepID=A0A4Z2EMH5_9TELE|nr:hypothetical protein EYF80_059892 [Liparis tanakae]
MRLQDRKRWAGDAGVIHVLTNGFTGLLQGGHDADVANGENEFDARDVVRLTSEQEEPEEWTGSQSQRSQPEAPPARFQVSAAQASQFCPTTLGRHGH